MTTRRNFIKNSALTVAAIGGSAASCGLLGSDNKSKNLRDMSLAELATEIRPDFMVGSHQKADHMTNTPENGKAQAIVAGEYSQISVGIYQKRTQRNAREDWDFSTVDPVVDFAEQHGLTVYAHPMFGSDGYMPDWLLNGGYSDDELLEIIEERIKTILTRYRGRIHIVDVYNEGLNRESRGWREPDNLFISMGYHQNEVGQWPVFLEKILQWCREYGGPDLKLIYNDNNNTHADQPQSPDCIQMYRALRQAGIPIDGIGIQLHSHIGADNIHRLGGGENSSKPAYSEALFAQNLRQMGNAGIHTYISECDVHLYGEINAAKYELQASAFRSFLKTCVEETSCKAFKTWGFTDASCWKPMSKNNPGYEYEPYPLVYDHNFEPKPAYHAMKDLLIGMIEG
jgi:endo-1,4-beta-xylanase